MNLFSKVIITSGLALLGAHAMATDYELDPSHANARFYIDHFGTSTNHGGFYNLEGKLQFDPAAKQGSIDISIPVAQINTGNADFDGHMKHADILNADKYPTIRFVSNKWHFDGEKVASVEGGLTILDKTHPVTLTATKFNCYDNPMLQARVCGGDFEADIDRSLWGVNFGIEHGVTKDVKLKIQVEAKKL